VSGSQERIFASLRPTSLCIRNLPGAVGDPPGEATERSCTPPRSNIMDDLTPMRRPDEDSPLRFGASNEKLEAWSPYLVRACNDAAEAAGAGTIEIVLARLREAAGADRAFLLEATPPRGRARVVASSVTRQDSSTAFSTSIATRALRGERPLFFADLRRGSVSADGKSVQSLALRSALAAPLPAFLGRRAAVVLDSRAPLRS
jgi:hypothetical protein